ncbi:MarR family winged helix-turn-helix transcriptional regulator [Pseudonocardia spinosispora]|uniref:MarR family winged helix-turn-helix transcriptional regulator n=1 Tax=Pseudonocardia spinosispora TaxID=103441 RepID=UPI000422E383|nr:MarR family transcriptional regulator [Pseudonocardia spinosispora]
MHTDAVDELLFTALPDWYAFTARLQELIAERLGIGATDLQCLHFLNRHGPTTAGELARRVGRSTGAVTRMIDRLERAGFVRRMPSDTDRRSVRVAPTPEGLTILTEEFEEIAERSRAVLAEHPESELGALLRLVRALTDQSAREMSRLLD